MTIIMTMKATNEIIIKDVLIIRQHQTFLVKIILIFKVTIIGKKQGTQMIKQMQRIMKGRNIKIILIKRGKINLI
jgi:hypothetical protein